MPFEMDIKKHAKTQEKFSLRLIAEGTGHSALHIMPTAWPREGWVVARKGQAGRREVSDMR